MSMMNVSLPQELKDYVDQLVSAGRYESASEMVRDALRQHKQFEALRVRALEDLARDVELGWADVDEGRVEDFDPEAIKAAGRRRLAQKTST
jgi:antitoxin ParD1/3/4